MVKILIVDDGAENRCLLETILQSRGYGTLSAPNGIEALRLARAQPVDLVISDILMPVMDGFSFCRIWRQEPELAGIPFVFYTATYSEPRDEHFALAVGADRFLLKPLAPERILREVRELLEGRSSPQSGAPKLPVEAAVFLHGHESALFRKLEQKLAAIERLQADNDRLGRILAASLNEIFVFDRTSLRFHFVNPAAREHLGYREDELEALTLLDLCPEWRAGALHALLQRLEDGVQEQAVVELAFRQRAGTTYPVELHLEPILDGGELSFLGVALDITERKVQDAARRQLEEALFQAQKLESLGRMASNVAHDMNNLLTPMLTLASLLQERYGDDAHLQRQLGIILHVAEQGRGMVAALTEFSHKGLTASQAVDLNGLLEKVAALLGPPSGPAVRWELELAPRLAVIQGDPFALGRALTNLCKNALEAMPEGGVLRLRTRCLEHGGVELEVIDQGSGIAPEALARVLEPFFTTKPLGVGTGLGLAIVNSVVRAHGGTLEIQSQVGEGTAIQLRFPA